MIRFLKILLPYLVFLFLVTNSLTAQSDRPNIIMIVVDDMRHDEWGGGGHTFLKTPNIDQLANEGSQFSRAYHAVPLCSPNRASILTGQYPSRHGILDNTSRNQASQMLDLFPKYLQKAGYKTGHVGKWHMGNSPKPRPGYDYWVCMEGQGKTYNPILYQDGQSKQVEGYITDIFTQKSIDFIQQVDQEPFFLYLGHKAIHPEAVQRDDGTIDLSVPKEFIPASRHQGIYAHKKFKRSPSHSPSAIADTDKPIIQNAFKIRAKTMAKDSLWLAAMDLGVSDRSIQKRAEMMLAVDESLGNIVSALKKKDIYDNTVIIFTSDNGYFFGEHGFSLERRMPYEESIRTPLIIRHPKISNPTSIIDGLVLSIDLSATALDLAHIEIPKSIQGKSLLPLIRGETPDIRMAALVEFYSNENPFPWTAQLDYRVVLADRYKYIKWLRFDESELYDLRTDPYERKNLINSSAHRSVLNQLKYQLENLQLEALGMR